MTTIRSLFFDLNTALWIEPYLQRLNALRLKRRSRFAWLLRELAPGDRRAHAGIRACAPRGPTRIARFSEPGRQTTRVEPGGLRLNAVNRLRAFGTLPPAAGLIDVSGAGSGQ